MLEDLLERVRAEVGPDARIVAANRVRKGGVGGFFARRRSRCSSSRPAPTRPQRRPHSEHRLQPTRRGPHRSRPITSSGGSREPPGREPVTARGTRGRRGRRADPRRRTPRDDSRARRRGERRRAQRRDRPRRGAQRLDGVARLRAGARSLQPGDRRHTRRAGRDDRRHRARPAPSNPAPTSQDAVDTAPTSNGRPRRPRLRDRPPRDAARSRDSDRDRDTRRLPDAGVRPAVPRRRRPSRSRRARAPTSI